MTRAIPFEKEHKIQYWGTILFPEEALNPDHPANTFLELKKSPDFSQAIDVHVHFRRAPGKEPTLRLFQERKMGDFQKILDLRFVLNPLSFTKLSSKN